MAIEFLCPQCQRRLRVPEDTAGRSARCPNCSQVAKIPAATDAPPYDRPRDRAMAHTLDQDAHDPFQRSQDDENPYAAPHGLPTPPRKRGPDALGPSPLASRGRRLAGAIVDALVRIGIVAATMIVPLIITMTTQGQGDEELLILLAVVFTILGALAGEAINCYLIAVSGQSVAKRWLGMRIVKVEDESLPGFVYGVLLRSWVPFVINQACSLFALVDVLFIFGDEQRCVHDYIASTNVIDVATERRTYL